MSPCGVPVAADRFDPEGMYVIGTLQEGIAGRDVFCDVYSPYTPSAGFPSLFGPGPASVSRDV